MNKKAISKMLIAAILVVIIAVASVLAYVFYFAPAPEEEEGPIKIGVNLGFSPPGLYELCEDMKIAMQMVVDEINADGGLLGRQIEFEWGDNAGTPDQTISVFEQQKLDPDIVAFLGPELSTTALAIYDRVESDGRPWIPYVWTNTIREQKMDNWFGVAPYYDLLTDGQMDFFLGKEFQDVVIFASDGAASAGMADNFETALTAANVNLHKKYVLDRNTVDFTQYLFEIAQDVPVMDLFLAGWETIPNAWTLYEQGIELGLFGPGTGCVFYDYGWVMQSEEFWPAVGDSGVYFTSANTFHARRPLTARGLQLHNEFYQKTGHYIKPTAYEAFDSILVILDAIKATDSTDATILNKYIEENSFVGTKAILTFAPDPDPASLLHHQTPLPILVGQYQAVDLAWADSDIVWPRQYATADFVLP